MTTPIQRAAGVSPAVSRYLILSLALLFAIACHAAAPGRSKTGPSTHKRGSSKPASTQKPQEVCLPETDLNSPRHTRLKSPTTNPNEIIRVDLDGDGVPDLIETWWNGKRVRWIGEGHSMKWTDVRGSMTNDALQIDRDGDGFYDGPDDINIKWVDDDNDGRPDVQIFAANPSRTQTKISSGASHFMIFIDDDHDGVLGYIDWDTFEFGKSNWRVPTSSPTNTTRPWHPQPTPNFSPDYNGNSTFLKQHYPAWLIKDPRYNWENPFLFFDTDNDGCTEMSIRILDTTTQPADYSEQNPVLEYHKKANDAYVSYDLDNNSQLHNELDYDMTLRFFSDPEGRKGERLDYSNFHLKHNMKAPQWVLDANLFRYDNWRRIDEFIYVPHDAAYDQIFKPKWGECWMTFDEDNDDHRWERVEMYYPSTKPYSTTRFTKAHEGGGYAGHPQSDTLGDRGEWDTDNSGRGELYIGAWDHKLHLFGAETGAWTVDYARYWGSTPVVGDSSPDKAPKVVELVQYEDTDKNGYFDKITYDYDGDRKPDLVINLLDYKTAENPHPDEARLLYPAELKWQGLHDAFTKLGNDSFQDATTVYRALWKKGLTDTDLDDLAIAASTWEQYDHGYWLKEKIFRLLDKRLAADKTLQSRLRQSYFTGDTNAMIKVIDSLDPMPQR